MKTEVKAMSLYGKKGNYFGQKNEGFNNSVWVELIGFEKTDPDKGAKRYLDGLGFKPDHISFHLTGVNFCNSHRGMDEEYLLPPYACSYGGHAANDDRLRQDWTNYDMKALVDALHSHGIKVFASFFEFGHKADDPFVKDHPEILNNGTPGGKIEMLKRFSDGTYYEDYLLKKMIETAKDYGLDGVQVADGLSSTRPDIWFGDFSDDIVEQSGIKVPEGQDAKTYISTYKRKEYIAFYRKRWSAFLKKLIGGLKAAGIKTQVNSAWTRDPFEAIYRYGCDYKAIDEAGADFFMVEDVSSDLSILECSYVVNLDRKLAHYEFVANLMAINAYTKLHTTPLFPIWDNLEQWDVIHHMPTLMQRGAAGNFTHFALRDGRYVPITGGPHFCLGDALTPSDWDFIRMSIDNGYTPDAIETAGATFIWSDARMENELDEFIDHGRIHSTRLLALLMRANGAVNKIARIDDISRLTGAIVVSNYDLLPESEQRIIDAYDKGKVIKVGIKSELDVTNVINPICWDWPETLTFAPIPEGYIEGKVAEINEGLNITIEGIDCTVNEVITGKNTARIVIDNNDYIYAVPVVRSKRPFKSVNIITKPATYPYKKDEHMFRLRVAPRGVDIIEVEYAE